MKIEVQMFKVIVRRRRYPDNYDFLLNFLVFLIILFIY